MGKYVMALDQGTTSSRAIVFDKGGHILAKAQREFEQLYPNAGGWSTIQWRFSTASFNRWRRCSPPGRWMPREIAAIGITNQRETTILWVKHRKASL